MNDRSNHCFTLISINSSFLLKKKTVNFNCIAITVHEMQPGGRRTDNEVLVNNFSSIGKKITPDSTIIVYPTLFTKCSSFVEKTDTTNHPTTRLSF